ncbi:MAG: hypothetical protein ABIO70_07030 [Pseudomonadota bacterium]
MRDPTLLALLALAGCGRSCAPEGRYAGECADGADNDGDGLYDCDDEDCAGAPDCAEGGEDTEDSDTHDGDHYTWEEFVDDYTRALCRKLDDCGVLEAVGMTYEDCVNPEPYEDTGEPWECQDYDARAAQLCVEQITAASCDDYSSVLSSGPCTEFCSNL